MLAEAYEEGGFMTVNLHKQEEAVSTELVEHLLALLYINVRLFLIWTLATSSTISGTNRLISCRPFNINVVATLVIELVDLSIYVAIRKCY